MQARLSQILVETPDSVENHDVSSPQPYHLVLAANVAAARTRLRLRQTSVAARMKALGWPNWYGTTVSEVEAGRRAIKADELLGLALTLETGISVLTSAPPGAASVLLPNGELIGAARLLSPVELALVWDGDVPKMARPGPVPGIDAQIAELRQRAAGLEALRDDLRRAPGESPLPPGPDAVDLPPG